MVTRITSANLQSRSVKDRLCSELKELLRDRFELLPGNGPEKALPTLRHNGTGTLFKFIPAGEFQMGLSEEEEKAARRIRDPFPASISEMRPVRNVHVDAFLLSSCPVTTKVFVSLAQAPPTGFQKPNYPVLVTYEEAARFSDSVGCCLADETQWEYACRGGTRTLFVWGDYLPARGSLAKWMGLDLKEGYEGSLACNDFDLYALFTGEWCKDEFRNTYGPGAPSRPGEHVVRGGAALFWPWQDQEWVWCMSAIRMPESGLFPDRQAAFRLVYNLGVGGREQSQNGG
jgi:formylglycine-generating enzyme required for sulfatase activity